MLRYCTLFALFAVAFSSGCGLIVNGGRNVINEPWLAKEEVRLGRQARSLAREAWDQQSTHANASEDYRDGYLDGYADYLEVGLTTDPPPSPPKRYLKITYHTPATLQAIEDYFAGFHAGAVDAQASGQRQRMVVPVVLPVCCPKPLDVSFVAPSSEQLPTSPPIPPAGR